ncbi:hypothetical protein WR25_26429 [Diploscapter pachys]|uniref:Ig-like domain-containing protein n=1 Tax=Diploscapter pachys TaxID=2018661 RepID=A0A2A2JLX8_9BILA|nr:hypothetical protein WR25_26429 [Diploscapter pachys]
MAEGSPLKLHCVRADGKSDGIFWLLNGVNLTLPSSSIVYESVTLEHHGIYECSSDGMSQYLRLKVIREGSLKPGERYCKGPEEEQSACGHGTWDWCKVDSSGNPYCVCSHGFTGKHCESYAIPPTSADQLRPVCPYWPPIITIMAFVVLLFVIGICLYKCNSKSKRSNKLERSKSQNQSQKYSNVTTLLVQSETTEAESKNKEDPSPA